MRRSLLQGLLCLSAACAWAGAARGDAPRGDAPRGDAPLDLDSARGRVVYLDFWASWCAPCIQSFPWMQRMADTYARQGLTVVAVNLDHDRRDAERFLRKYNSTFEIRFDPHGQTAEHFKVKGMPTSVVIDRKGAPRFTHTGYQVLDQAAYEAQIRELLAEQ